MKSLYNFLKESKEYKTYDDIIENCKILLGNYFEEESKINKSLKDIINLLKEYNSKKFEYICSTYEMYDNYRLEEKYGHLIEEPSVVDECIIEPDEGNYVYITADNYLLIGIILDDIEIYKIK